jgi:hypothetical protein
MSDQPKITDQSAWKRISNSAVFFTGWICFMLWLCNNPLQPARYVVLQGRRVVPVAPPAIEPEHLGAFGYWMLHTGLLMIAIGCLALSIVNYLYWKKQAEAQEKLGHAGHEPAKPYAKFSRGARDTGPTKLPPWPELVMAGMGLVIMFVSATFGIAHEWIGDVFVRGPAAFLTMSGLMFALGFATAAKDKARSEGQDDDENGD